MKTEAGLGAVLEGAQLAADPVSVLAAAPPHLPLVLAAAWDQRRLEADVRGRRSLEAPPLFSPAGLERVYAELTVAGRWARWWTHASIGLVRPLPPAPVP